MTVPDPLTFFGKQSVQPDQKQSRVNDIFQTVASDYDKMNDLLSFGLHRLWKKLLIQKIALPLHRPYRHLDVAGGTGDIALALAQTGGPQTESLLLDIQPAMLAEARRRLADLPPFSASFSCLLGNAENLPLADRSLDSVTCVFGLRNVPRRRQALSEFYRVLKRGGRFFCLEFSPLDSAPLRALYNLYVPLWPKIGQWIVGDGEPYRYLADSIETFPTKEQLKWELAEAGFHQPRSLSLSGGLVALHWGWRIT